MIRCLSARAVLLMVLLCAHHLNASDFSDYPWQPDGFVPTKAEMNLMAPIGNAGAGALTAAATKVGKVIDAMTTPQFYLENPMPVANLMAAPLRAAVDSARAVNSYVGPRHDLPENNPWTHTIREIEENRKQLEFYSTQPIRFVRRKAEKQVLETVLQTVDDFESSLAYKIPTSNSFVRFMKRRIYDGVADIGKSYLKDEINGRYDRGELMKDMIEYLDAMENILIRVQRLDQTLKDNWTKMVEMAAIFPGSSTEEGFERVIAANAADLQMLHLRSGGSLFQKHQNRFSNQAGEFRPSFHDNEGSASAGPLSPEPKSKRLSTGDTESDGVKEIGDEGLADKAVRLAAERERSHDWWMNVAHSLPLPESDERNPIVPLREGVYHDNEGSASAGPLSPEPKSKRLPTGDTESDGVKEIGDEGLADKAVRLAAERERSHDWWMNVAHSLPLPESDERNPIVPLREGVYHGSHGDEVDDGGEDRYQKGHEPEPKGTRLRESGSRTIKAVRLAAGKERYDDWMSIADSIPLPESDERNPIVPHVGKLKPY